MLSFSVSDILKLLEQIPIWKTLSQLPKRVQALEEECSALRQKLDALGTPKVEAAGDPCPACGQRAMRRTSRHPNPDFGDMGAMDETWVCGACGETETRFVTPP